MLPWRSLRSSGGRQHLLVEGQHHLLTEDATCAAPAQWPILWRVLVAQDRCNAHKGMGQLCWLKVCAKPLGNQAPETRPDSRSSGELLHPQQLVWLPCSGESSPAAPTAVMPLDVLGRTRATLTEPTSSSPWPEGLGNPVKLCRAGDRALQLLLFNEECLVSACHQHALITSLPFVHTARRYYRLNGSVRPSDWLQEVGNDHPEPESWSDLVI